MNKKISGLKHKNCHVRVYRLSRESSSVVT